MAKKYTQTYLEKVIMNCTNSPQALAEIVLGLLNASGGSSDLSSTVSSLGGRVETLETNYETLNGKVEELEGKINENHPSA